MPLIFMAYLFSAAAAEIFGGKVSIFSLYSKIHNTLMSPWKWTKWINVIAFKNILKSPTWAAPYLMGTSPEVVIA